MKKLSSLACLALVAAFLFTSNAQAATIELNDTTGYDEIFSVNLSGGGWVDGYFSRYINIPFLGSRPDPTSWVDVRDSGEFTSVQGYYPDGTPWDGFSVDKVGGTYNVDAGLGGLQESVLQQYAITIPDFNFSLWDEIGYTITFNGGKESDLMSFYFDIDDSNDATFTMWLKFEILGVTDYLFWGPAGPVDFTFTAYGTSYDPEPVPEPTTLALMGLGIVGLGIVRARRNKK